MPDAMDMVQQRQQEMLDQSDRQRPEQITRCICVYL